MKPASTRCSTKDMTCQLIDREPAIPSPLIMAISEMEKQKRARFALLARVGHQKREVSQLHEEADFYSSIATGLLALSTELLTSLEAVEAEHPALKLDLVTQVAKHTSLLKRLLSYWPQNITSEQRFLELLDSDGVAISTDTLDDVYVSPSMDRMVRNVARAIEVTKMASSQKQSSSLGQMMQ